MTIIVRRKDGPPAVEVTIADRTPTVLLLAMPLPTRGWVDLTPTEAREVARALMGAADRAERERA